VKAARRHAIEAALAGGIATGLRFVPRSLSLRLGQGFGCVLGRLARRHVGIAIENLRLAFPDWGDARLLHVARGVYVHFCRMLFDILWFSARSNERLLRSVEFIGREHGEAALASGRGVLFVTCHMGNWEIFAVAQSLVHKAVGVVARPLDNPELDARLCGFRGRGGNTVIYKKNALSQIMRTLRGGGGIAILIDQNVQEKDGIFVDFFGRKAATTTVAAAVALKTNCLIVTVHAVLRPDGFNALYYDPPLEWTTSGDRAADIARLTQLLTGRIEGWIRETPEQWLWMHRRWKTRPPA
jgi:Kdo2-lipid IVA lauroyltransferase/acyltransferase